MIHTNVKIFEGAKVVSDVKIDEKSSAWFNAVVRGDIGDVTIGTSSNIQDNCVVHSPAEIFDYVTVGHSTVLHSCKIQNNCLIGINATILTEAKIRNNSIVGAGAVVTEKKRISRGKFDIGGPCKRLFESLEKRR